MNVCLLVLFGRLLEEAASVRSSISQKCKIYTYWQALHTHTHTHTVGESPSAVQSKKDFPAPPHISHHAHVPQSKSPRRAGLWFFILHSYSAATSQFSPTSRVPLCLICGARSRLSV